MNKSDLPDVCVLTQPARREGRKTHAHQLLDIIAAVTSVVMLTANLDDDSSVREDYEVVEVSDKGISDSLPITIYRFGKIQLNMSLAILRREEEVMLFFGATAYVLPILVSRAAGKTVIVEPRGDVPLSLRHQWEERVPSPIARGLSEVVSLLEHIGYTGSNAIITYTPKMATELGLEKYRDKLYTNGARYVDTGAFTVTTPFKEREPVVGYLGRLDAEKEIPTLVEVARKLPEDIQFRFVGDGDNRNEVERELADEIERGSVELTGWVDHDQVPQELNRMRMLLLTSEPTEGLPTAILEAFACGTPVYATPVSGVPDVIREKETGFLMTNRDPESIASTIDDTLESEALVGMSEKCRKTAETEFSFEAAVGRYRTILESVAVRQ